MQPNRLFMLCFFRLSVFAYTNLFDDGRVEPLLGTTFGVPGVNGTFDYVIVGGGTAGLTLASRLAEEPSISVAVVEAGGFYEIDNGNLSVVPSYAPYYTGLSPSNFQPLVDWGFVTTPQPAANNRSQHYARGKTLGGSSARNYMLYHRPTVGTMQQWADVVGDDSYTWDNFEQYFKKSPHYTAPNQSLFTNATYSQTPDAFSPTGGPLQVTTGSVLDPFGTWVQKLFQSLGMSALPGLNSGKLIGSSYATYMIDPRNGHRSSSEASFLQTALQNGRGPTIYKNTLAQQILFDPNMSAIGVSALTAGTFGTPSLNFTLAARREVILSAGAIQSPQLLMVSGIGPCTHLAEHNIPCLQDLPGVGQNMWEHPDFGITHRVNVNTNSASLNNATIAALNVQRYLSSGTGPLASFAPGFYGFEKFPEPFRSNFSNTTLSLLSTIPSDWPEIEWLPQSSYQGDGGNRLLTDPRDGHNYATLTAGLVHPFSRGSITLRSPSMTVPPVIDINALSHPADMELAIQAFKRLRFGWRMLVDAGLADPVETYPGDNVQSDAQIRNAIGKMLQYIYHVSATCAMGQDREKNPMAVVDAKARVFGVKQLRVVDASAFPFLPPGHPTSVVYGLAEKVVEDILNERG